MLDITVERKHIEEIDAKMAALFEERMHCAEMIGKYKIENGLKVYDPVRERELLEKNGKLIEDLTLRPYYLQFMQNVMDISKRYQHKLMEGANIAYSGIEGSFASIAVDRVFPDGNKVSFGSFREAYKAVVTGDCDAAVLPIENSSAGEVGQVMDLMYEGDLYINGVYALKISQNLLGIKGTKITDIKTVISHPQALEQCSEYISDHGFKIEQASNTARAAKEVADRKDPGIAAIASKETAELYGLSILDHDINESSVNTTRFAVFSKSRESIVSNERLSSYILMFTVKNEAGGLADAIAVIGKHGYSMRVLRSRPVKNTAWQYYFYVEVEGKLSSKEGEEMLKDLDRHCMALKVLGSYAIDSEIL
ncbi:MAG: chorismate mutase [Lachnospiraceae bacterium]|nr:chorismate mutase [Lachnospiraceae bacterium]